MPKLGLGLGAIEQQCANNPTLLLSYQGEDAILRFCQMESNPGEEVNLN
jgi:hypothetical protein